ncbi:MAG: LLM class flavin-dependent oxidoreductase [Thermomicrobiales bacterium]|nr:LLM class flavin-dependent oxidoreductase [Thermomicrobiales bacterium]MCO5222180.1 LLM class flavin-dependent oxidoreductase [Thermomicrobiales bacterium]
MTRFGLLLPLGGFATPQSIASRAVEAEAAGFDSAWVIEDYYSWEAFGSLGYVAAVTKRVELGISVTTPYVRSAPLLASSAATLDQFADGRLILGLGRSSGTMLGQIGIDDRKPFATMREYTEAMRLLWRGGEMSYDGQVVKIDRIVPDMTPVDGSVPIVIGAIGPKMLELAGEIADGVVLTGFSPPAYVAWAVEHVAAGAARAGRNLSELDIIVMVATRITDEIASATEELKPWLGLAYGMNGRGEIFLTGSGIDPTVLEPIRQALKIDEILSEGLEPYLHSYKRVTPASVAATVPDHLVTAAAVISPPDAARAQLQAFIDAGATHIIVDSPQPADVLLNALA